MAEFPGVELKANTESNEVVITPNMEGGYDNSPETALEAAGIQA